MALPAGVSTATVTINPPVTHEGEPLSVVAYVEPSHAVIHSATGVALAKLTTTTKAASGAAVTLTLPHTDQPGFVDTSGQVFTGWAYTIRVDLVGADGRTQYVYKTFQVPVGTVSLDYMVIISGTPSDPLVAPTAVVTSVNGMTGAVLLDGADTSGMVTSGAVNGAGRLILTRADTTTVDAGLVVGPPGPANTLTIGTVTTGVAGSPAAANITGLSPNQTLALTIPKGDAGDAGGGAISDLIRPQWHAVYHVGPSRAHTTISAAVTAARTYANGYSKDGQGFDGSLLNLRGRGGKPAFHRSLIALDPGTYTETANLELGDGIDLIGLGASRDDVVIVNGTSNYNVRSYGSIYIANLTLHHAQGPTGNNYGFHGSHVPGISNITTIFDNVKFFDTNTGSTGIVGYDMTGGMMLFFNKCRFESTTGRGNILHDETGYTTGITTVFLECEADVALNVDHSRVGKGQAWVTDCKMLDGTTRASTVTIDTGTAQTTKARPPHPSRGMTDNERHRYFPTKAKGTPALLTPKYPDLAAQTFTAGRIYYIPIRPEDLDFSALVSKSRMHVVTPAGTVGAGLYFERPVDAGKPSSPLIFPAAVSAVAGTMEFSVASSWGPLFLDVGFRVWIGIRINDATCQVLSSAQMSRVAQCWYEDGSAGTGLPTYPATANMVQVPAGMAVPWGAMLTA